MARYALVAAAAFGFLLTIALGNLIVPILQAMRSGKKVLKGLPWSAYKGAKPTMGGLCFILASIISLGIVGSAVMFAEPLLLGMDWMGETQLVLWSAFAIGAVGFVEDIVRQRNKAGAGLPTLVKWALLALALLVLMLFYWENGLLSSTVVLPFFGFVDFGVSYIPILFFIVFFFVRSVDVTEGISGLCSSTILLILLAVCSMCVLLNAFELAIFPAALAGSLLAFLFWNFPPAKIHMGSTGSMFLAGAVFGLVQLLNWPGLLLLIALPYWFEGFSVIIQRISIRFFHKKIFRAAPFHNFLLERGWSEVKVIYAFCGFTIIGIVLSAMFLRLGGAI